MTNQQTNELRLPFDTGLGSGLLVYFHRFKVWLTVAGLNFCALGILYAAIRYPQSVAALGSSVIAIAVVRYVYSNYLKSEFQDYSKGHQVHSKNYYEVEFAQTAKRFGELEKQLTDAKTLRIPLDSSADQKTALRMLTRSYKIGDQAPKSAKRLTSIDVLEAEAELLRRLNELGVVIYCDIAGNLILRMPEKLAEQIHARPASSKSRPASSK